MMLNIKRYFNAFKIAIKNINLINNYLILIAKFRILFNFSRYHHNIINNEFITQ